ncbi:hypothetical protein MPUCK001_11030 [Citrobacter koseri]|nr:hypothetical protein MPUCK001_11030 [Citrobacter koseri]
MHGEEGKAPQYSALKCRLAPYALTGIHAQWGNDGGIHPTEPGVNAHCPCSVSTITMPRVIQYNCPPG